MLPWRESIPQRTRTRAPASTFTGDFSVMSGKKTSQKAQATHTNGRESANASEVMPNLGVRLQRRKAYAAAEENFGDLADKLAVAMANVLDHGDCPEFLAQRIAELHNSVVNEFNCETSHDVRVRFADACVYAAENH